MINVLFVYGCNAEVYKLKYRPVVGDKIRFPRLTYKVDTIVIIKDKDDIFMETISYDGDDDIDMIAYLEF